jgi:transcription antitermination factor NusB
MYNKSIARIACVQAVYYKSLVSSSQEEITKDMIDFYSTTDKHEFSKQNVSFFCKLFELAELNQDKIEELIYMHLADNWSMSSLHITLMCLLKVSISEILFFPTPKNVILNEYTSIAADMLADGDESFINAVLNKISDYLSNKKNEIQ